MDEEIKKINGSTTLLFFSVNYNYRALPLILDSDEEVMTTKFEISKMN